VAQQQQHMLTPASNLQVVDLEDSSGEALDNMRREVCHLSSLASEHIVRYHGTQLKGHRLWLVMEWMELSVADWVAGLGVREGEKALDEEVVAVVLRDVLRGLAFLHAQGLVHRDVKGSNCLIAGDLSRVKLGDLGLAAPLRESRAGAGVAPTRAADAAGTPLFLAPETVARGEASDRADVWALGITAVEAAAGRPPHADKPPARALAQIAAGPPPALSPLFSRDLRDFVAAALVQCPPRPAPAPPGVQTASCVHAGAVHGARRVRTPLTAAAAGPRRDPASRPSAARLLAHRVPARADAGALRNALAARRPPLAFSTRSGRTPSPGAARSSGAAHRREDGCWTFSEDSSEARPPARPRLLRAGCRPPPAARVRRNSQQALLACMPHQRPAPRGRSVAAARR
jgi:serine/threonine protein kinase